MRKVDILRRLTAAAVLVLETACTGGASTVPSGSPTSPERPSSAIPTPSGRLNISPDITLAPGDNAYQRAAIECLKGYDTVVEVMPLKPGDEGNIDGRQKIVVDSEGNATALALAVWLGGYINGDPALTILDHEHHFKLALSHGKGLNGQPDTKADFELICH